MNRRRFFGAIAALSVPAGCLPVPAVADPRYIPGEYVLPSGSVVHMYGDLDNPTFTLTFTSEDDRSFACAVLAGRGSGTIR